VKSCISFSHNLPFLMGASSFYKFGAVVSMCLGYFHVLDLQRDAGLDQERVDASSETAIAETHSFTLHYH
ncbi:hypothetical protein ACJX0J_009834, partial [Zea mays]